VNNLQDLHLKGFVTRNELRHALERASKAPQVIPSTKCYFSLPAFPESNTYVDLRPFVNSKPITLNHHAPMQLCVKLFLQLVKFTSLHYPGRSNIIGCAFHSAHCKRRAAKGIND
jgi:hypothetical protein